MCKDLGNNVYQCNGSCASGSVWGTGIYTADSNLWSAAKHMGYLPGIFTKIPGPGLPGFVGTSQNGITTLNYGNYGSTFYLYKGVLNPGPNNQAIEVQAKNLQTRVEALSKVEQNLSSMVKNYEGVLNGILEKIERKERDLAMVQERMQSDSKRSADLNELQLRMRELYVTEMKRYNQNINNYVQKDILICSVCCERQRDAMVMPCGHAHYCKNCAKTCLMDGKCKVCSAEITGYQTIQLQ